MFIILVLFLLALTELTFAGRFKIHGDFVAVKNAAIDSPWLAKLDSIFVTAVDQLEQQGFNVVDAKSLTDPYMIHSCMGFTVERYYRYADYVALIRLENEPSKDYVAYSDVCDSDTIPTSAETRFYGGIIVWNVYTLNKYFDIGNINHSWRLVEIMMREFLHITCANEVLLNFYKTAVFQAADPPIYLQPGVKLIKLPTSQPDWLISLDCPQLDTLPIVPATYGTGFFFPMYLFPNSLLANKKGYEGLVSMISGLEVPLIRSVPFLTFQPKVIPQTLSFDTLANGGLTLGCNFVSKGCKADLTQDFNQFCNVSNSKKCTMDYTSIGVCTPLPDFPDCSVYLPQVVSDKPVTCQTYPNPPQTGQNQRSAYTQKSACVYTTQGAQPSTYPAVCVEFSWDSSTSNYQVTQFIPQNIQKGSLATLQFDDVDVSGFYEQWKTLFSIPAEALVGQGAVILESCNSKGMALISSFATSTCSCFKTYQGPGCEEQCLDEFCRTCDDPTTLSCNACLDGYSLFQNYRGKFCIQATIPLPTGCDFARSLTQCVQCNESYGLALDPLYWGKCVQPVVLGCTAYNPNTTKCTACDGEFTFYQGGCYTAIPQCSVQTGGTCQTCVNSYAVDDGALGCSSVITNCTNYTTGSCNKCIANNILVASQADPTKGVCQGCNSGEIVYKMFCVFNDTHCVTRKAQPPYKCDTCENLYEIMDDKCQIRIQHCSEQSYNNGDPICTECSNDYFQSADQKSCYLTIENCETYNGPLCTVCQGFRRPSDDKSICYENYTGCLDYLDVNCIKCEEGYNLLEGRCFYKQTGCHIQNFDMCTQCNMWLQQQSNLAGGFKVEGTNLTCLPCGTNEVAVPPQLDTCVDHMENCIQLIDEPDTYYLWSDSASYVPKCKNCSDGFHVSISQLLCMENVFGCIEHSDLTCLKCQDNMMLQNGTCYWNKFGCTQQTADFCQECQQFYQVIEQDIEGVANKTCNKCQDGFIAIPPDVTTCVVAIEHCKTVALNGNEVGCGVCDQGYHVSANGKLCYSDLVGCLTYPDDKCSKCDDTLFLLQDGQCWYKIFGCQNQVHDSCYKCLKNLIQSPFPSNGQNLTCTQCQILTYIVSVNNFCMPPVLNCLVYASENNTCLLCESGYYLDIFTNKCQPPIKNCLVRSVLRSDQCAICDNKTQLIKGQCSTCLLPNCQDCKDQKFCYNCLSSFVMNKKQQCLTDCQNKYSLTNCSQCSILKNKAQCTQCLVGSYLNGAECALCSQSFAYCQNCTSKGCNTCLEGYYINSRTQYCEPCNKLVSNCLFCNQSQCLICESGYSSQNGQCVSCDNIVTGSANCNYLTPATPMRVAYSCSENFYFTGDFEKACVACTTYNDNCFTCNPKQCLKCAYGYRLNSLDCVKCPDACLTCDTNDVCIDCPPGTVKSGITCINSIANFSLTNQTPNSQAITFVNQRQVEITKSALYPTIGTVDSQGQFCTSDQECNVNGRCKIAYCQCYANYFGKRCQFSTIDKASIRTHQIKILTYLNSRSKVDNISDFTAQVNISFVISDGSSISLKDIINEFSTVIGRLVDYDIQNTKLIPDYVTQQLLSTIGALIEGFQMNPAASEQQINYFQKQQQRLLRDGDSIKVQTPFQSTIAVKNDLNDPAQQSQFKQQFQVSRRILQQVCTDQTRILQPQVIIGSDVYEILKSSQPNPYEELQYEISLYQTNPHFNKSVALDDYSTFARVEFLTADKKIKIQNVQPIQITIPKKDQRDSVVNSSYKCVTWNSSINEWTEDGIIKELTIHCPNYIQCFTTHLSDFAVIYDDYKPSSSPEFDSYALSTNAAWWLSISWVILFALLSVYNWGKYEIQPPTSMNKIATNDGKDAEKGQDNQVLMSEAVATNQLASARGGTTKLQTEYSDEWMAFPLISILCSSPNSSASVQTQKVCLLVLQLQMFTFITAGFMSIDPFIRGVFVVYYLAAIILTWISNYMFGFIAVKTRSNAQVSPVFFLLWFFVFFGLSIVGVYFMFDLDASHDGFLVLGVFVEIIADMLILDFLFAVLCNAALKKGEKGGIISLARMRGFL